MRLVLVFAVVACHQDAPPVRPVTPVASAVAPHTAPRTLALGVANGELTGAGADVLRAELPHAQFILYGEDHGFADSPIVLRALAREARAFGFAYHAIEVGPLSVHMIRDALAHDGTAGVHELVHEVPLGIPFLSLQDDAELASDFLGVDAKGEPFLWGLDQEFIGSPPFHLARLVAIAKTDAGRAAAQQLLDDERAAAATAAQDRFLLARYSDADFTALAAKFNGNAEAETIIAALEDSAAIYQLWMHDHNFDNNTRRAQLLARNFLAAYNAAADPEPKVVFKMGVEHVGLGTTPINTVDVGTLATELARIHGKTSLRIAFLPTGGHNITFAPKPGNPTSIAVYKSKEVGELFTEIGLDPATLATTGWTLVPLGPIREALDTRGLAKLSTFSRFILLGYDYVITTPDAKAGVSLY